MVNFSQMEGNVSLNEIEAMEKFIDLKFPNEYKAHLLQYNGGRCFPNVFKYNENGNWIGSCVDWFLAIYDGKFDNLEKYFKTYKIEEKRLPAHMLPIAHDPGGNLICISCDTDDKGCLYFWDHENEVDYCVKDDSDYSNLYLIANGFNEFINGLKEDCD
ncbi:MAG: SMI1/KNR4 family protein [Ignavibacteria bacterium]|nr:SMI1/KNR4 family protein [Ignavibacteria bacterium]